MGVSQHNPKCSHSPSTWTPHSTGTDTVSLPQPVRHWSGSLACKLQPLCSTAGRINIRRVSIEEKGPTTCTWLTSLKTPRTRKDLTANNRLLSSRPVSFQTSEDRPDANGRSPGSLSVGVTSHEVGKVSYKPHVFPNSRRDRFRSSESAGRLSMICSQIVTCIRIKHDTEYEPTLSKPSIHGSSSKHDQMSSIHSR